MWSMPSAARLVSTSWRSHSGRASRTGPSSVSRSPPLVAITTSSRAWSSSWRSAVPRMRSAVPNPYSWAVSKKLKPRSRARRTIATAFSSSTSPHAPLNSQVPSARRETSRPLRPSVVVCTGSVGFAAEDLSAGPGNRVITVTDYPLFHRDNRVVGDGDALRTDLGAALGDVAQPQAGVVLGEVAAVGGVQRVHLQLRQPDEHPRPRERLLVLLVVADHVADVLAQEALDALAELLGALHIHLLHPVFAGLESLRWLERR